MTPVVRRLTAADWPRVIALESEAYRGRGLSESPAALRSRARVSPSTALVVDIGGEVAGYLLALPYPPSGCPDLTRCETAVHRSANLHLHDLVVAGRARRTGLGGLLLGHLVRQARDAGCERISLVSVAGSSRFWAARGFVAQPGVRVPPGYGAGAMYMSRRLDKEG
ncbi:GNAT family N-acetyltransferase [Actinoplanes teichomyceticus]|uniref:Putative N-acetyltransferase YhbS n=1 Tax=Actinoplanes teichomyceticus TaxID=1867 RepID=A0A561WKR0_ACTTI|nr:GNAT family N-acetyltransferase [Actinoplanes teichomyceticus]TWG24451.1 putative N-acetyltransferase YhbS [Actinoplanes teichomyceticus]GIF12698.1 N-acetyltransferase [Actinoplanes teichomyceticus]